MNTVSVNCIYIYIRIHLDSYTREKRSCKRHSLVGCGAWQPTVCSTTIGMREERGEGECKGRLQPADKATLETL